MEKFLIEYKTDTLEQGEEIMEAIVALIVKLGGRNLKGYSPDDEAKIVQN